MVIRQKASPALTPGLWCRAHFFSEKEKAGGGTGVEALLDVGEGEVREVIRQEGEEGAAHQTEIGEDVEPLLLRLGGHPHGRGCAALRRSFSKVGRLGFGRFIPPSCAPFAPKV
jgi:hypothetical protein